MTAPLAISVGGTDITNRVPIESIVVTESGSRQPGKLDCDVLDATNALALNPKAQVQVWDVADGRYIFTGYLNPADLNMLGVGRSFHLSCDDLGEIIDLSLVPMESRPAETFYARMVYLISTYGPLMPQIYTYIDNPGGSLPACVYQNTNLRGAIEQTCSLAGTAMDYWIDGAGLIHATISGAGAAPFVLRVGTPGGGEINPEEPFSITRDPKTIVNAYYIRGNNAAGSGWVTNGTSIALYGRREAYYDAPNATTGAMRDAVGNALLTDNAQALSQGKVHVTAANGWKPGQTLTIVSAPQFDITSSTTFRINLVTRKYFAGGNTKTYDIQFGGLIPMWSTSIPSPQSWTGQRIQAGSLSITPFADTVRPVVIVATLPSLPDASYPPDCYVVLTTDHKLYQNLAGTWVNAVNQGLPVGFDGIPSVGTLPGLPNVAYPVDGFVYLTTDHKLYRNIANVWSKAVDGADITAATIVGNSLVAGTITASQIAAHTITAAEIAASTITAAEIAADTITAGQIAAGAINVSELAAGAVTAAKIAAGAITADKLSIGTAGGVVPLTNPGFESGDTSGWSTSGSVAARGANGSDALLPTGTYLCSINGSGYIDQGNMAVRGGEWVHLSALLGWNGGSYPTAYFQIWARDVTGADISQLTAGFVVSVATTYTAKLGPLPPGTAYIGVRIICAPGPSSLLVDDVVLSRFGSLISIDGSVVIDSAGVAITNGKLTVNNGAPGAGTVIIDGSSNMFKIAATGTLSVQWPSAASTSATQAITLTGLGSGFSVAPALLVNTYGDWTTGRSPGDIYFVNSTDGSIAGVATTRITLSSGTPVVTLDAHNYNASLHAYTAYCRWYVLVEAGI